MTTPLMIISGHLCDARIFAEVEPRIQGSADVLQVSPPSEATIDAMAKALLARGPDRFAVAGFSLGGMVAMAMIEQAPERLLGAAMISTDPHAARDVEIKYRDHLLEAARRYTPAVYADALVASFFTHKPSLGATLGPDLREMTMAEAPERMAREAGALSARADRIAALSKYKGAVSVIVGASDRLCPPRLSEHIADACSDATLTEIADTGHMAPLEAPAGVADALETWLARLEPAASSGG